MRHLVVRFPDLFLLSKSPPEQSAGLSNIRVNAMTRQWGRVLVTSNIQTLLLRALLAVLAICLAGRVVKDTHATTLSPMEKVASPPFPISTDCEKLLLRDVQSDAFKVRWISLL